MIKKDYVLVIPSWYPSKNDTFLGIFINEHLTTFSDKINLKVFFIKGHDKQKRIIEFCINKDQNIENHILYFKKYPIRNKILNNLYKIIMYLFCTIYGYLKIFLKFGFPRFIHIHVVTKVAIVPYFLNIFFQIPYVISEQFTRYIPEDGSYKTGNLSHFILREILRKSSGLSAISYHLLNSMNNLGLISKYQTIIPNVLNQHFELQKPLNPKNSELNIIHVSTLNNAQKNIVGIIDALEIVSQAAKKTVLNIYGGYEPYLSEIKSYSLTKSTLNINFYGKVDKALLAQKIAESDLLILFSNYETQGCVIFESLACGTPVIVSDLKPILEFMTEDLGIIVQRGNIVALADEIINFNSDKFDSLKLKEASLKKFSHEVIREKWLQFFKNAKVLDV